MREDVAGRSSPQSERASDPASPFSENPSRSSTGRVFSSLRGRPPLMPCSAPSAWRSSFVATMVGRLAGRLLPSRPRVRSGTVAGATVDRSRRTVVCSTPTVVAAMIARFRSGKRSRAPYRRLVPTSLRSRLSESSTAFDGPCPRRSPAPSEPSRPHARPSRRRWWDAWPGSACRRVRGSRQVLRLQHLTAQRLDERWQRQRPPLPQWLAVSGHARGALRRSRGVGRRRAGG